MEEVLVGPWSLKGWSRDGEDFDVHGFIREAEAGRYPEGCGMGMLDRSAPWYQQLKMDVEAGLYDRTPESEERYREALARYVEVNRKFCRSEEDVAGLEQDFCDCPNTWILMASLVSTDMPRGAWQMHAACRTESILRSFPERGWHHGGCNENIEDGGVLY